MKLLSVRLESAIADWESKNNQKLTSTAFAEVCGVSKQTVGDWRKGRTQSMTGEALLNGSDFLCVKPRWLCSGTGVREQPLLANRCDQLNTLNIEAADFAVQGILEYYQTFPKTMGDEDWRKRAFTVLYKAWFNEEMRRLGVVPLLDLVA
tara:strand:- start:671 stop:1120 length:450 start_codon:yes stop_codon:yes gene_type:complete